MAIGMMRVKIEKNNRYMCVFAFCVKQRAYLERIMKRNKGSGNTIIATARKLTKFVWTLRIKRN